MPSIYIVDSIIALGVIIITKVCRYQTHTRRQLGCIGTIASPEYTRLNISISNSVVCEVKYETVLLSRDNDVKHGRAFATQEKVYIDMMNWSVYTQQEMAHEPLKKREAVRVHFSLQ